MLEHEVCLIGGRSASRHLGIARKWLFVSVIQGCEQSWTKQDRLTSGYNWQVFHAKLRFSNVLAAVVNAADRVVKETLFSCTWMKRDEKQNCWKKWTSHWSSFYSLCRAAADSGAEKMRIWRKSAGHKFQNTFDRENKNLRVEDSVRRKLLS